MFKFATACPVNFVKADEVRNSGSMCSTVMNCT